MSLDSLNVTEQIYSVAAGHTSHYLVQSRAKDGVWELALWLRPNAQEPNNLQLWIGIGEDTSNVDEISRAMIKGDMSVDTRPNGGRKKNSVYLDAASVSENIGLLLDGAFLRNEGSAAAVQADLDAANIEKLGGRIRAQQAELQRAAHTGLTAQEGSAEGREPAAAVPEAVS
ncbi:hypothetical protein A1Q1_00587 [Trichosporon asahii var. asahii CBS 2479]|uniref:Uncharacterized protein n=1 Tax=Trichosporon asahii var. asahii (strain ATCC 90039 / CBS 2479 / JCM 2466 / KCTC 7840 / NBRC 103889/ NCYC 2677 / UAMH 7654) TaxID=1186058 RepID=J4UFH3_TRIAS|nr:hypothetical protein A1Q1_00587 [Trichosporon asahii var. asahii CBS 2479]EJT50120.1 hypothetical protein A1Q1_00587 [Trichosporon asahii var. asahii CBS 2479]